MTIDNQGKPSRRLTYPLKNPLVMVSEISDGDVVHVTPDFFPVDNDEKIDVTFNLSLNEFVAIASALDIGRDIGYGENSNEIWWIWVRSLLGVVGMSCEEVADCIENDADVLAALLAKLAASGFTPNPDAADAGDIKPISATQSASNMLPAGFDCSEPAHNMSIARWIVRELHESVIDIFETIELATNVVEAANIATDGTPILGTLNNVTEMANWMQETLAELYQASYNQSSEDELACAIFCYLETDCSLSLDELIGIYEGAGGQIPTDIDDLQAAITESINFTLNVSVATVATAHCMVLWLLRFGDKAFGITGWNFISNGIKSAAEWNDYSYDDCDDCPPETTATTYWRIYQDAAIGEGEFEPQATFGTYETGGWRSNTGNPTIVRVGIPDLSTTWAIYGLGFEFQARGFTSLSTDLANFACWAGVGYTSTLLGTPYTAANFTSASDVNDNRVGWVAAPTGVAGVRSVRMQLQTGGVYAAGTNFVKATKILVVGACGAGDSMPPGAEYYTDTLPATVQELFPDYVAP